MQVDGLLLQRPPQPFDEDIVEVSSPIVHSYFDVSLCQRRNPDCARLLAALVCSHYLWLAISSDCHQIQKLVFDGDVGDVAAPNLIGPRDGELPQRVWINALLWVLLAGVRPLVGGLQPHDVHQATHALPPG